MHHAPDLSSQAKTFELEDGGGKQVTKNVDCIKIKQMTVLQQLEEEAIYILREVAWSNT